MFNLMQLYELIIYIVPSENMRPYLFFHQFLKCLNFYNIKLNTI